MQNTVTVVGIGTMGEAIAKKVCSNLKTYTYDADTSLEVKGCQRITNIKDICSEVLILCLPDSVVLDKYKKKLLENKNLKIIIDHTTNHPEMVAQFYTFFNDKKIEYIEAPMVGGVRSVRNSNLTILTTSNVKNSNPQRIMKSYTKKFIYSGEKLNPSKYKLLHNLVTISNSNIFLEILHFAEKIGLNKEKFFEIIQNGTASSYVSTNTLVRTILNDNYDDGFKLKLAFKDIKYAFDLSRQSNLNLPIINIVRKYMKEALKQEKSFKDYPIVTQTVKKIICKGKTI